MPAIYGRDPNWRLKPRLEGLWPRNPPARVGRCVQALCCLFLGATCRRRFGAWLDTTGAPDGTIVLVARQLVLARLVAIDEALDWPATELT